MVLHAAPRGRPLAGCGRRGAADPDAARPPATGATGGPATGATAVPATAATAGPAAAGQHPRCQRQRWAELSRWRSTHSMRRSRHSTWHSRRSRWGKYSTHSRCGRRSRHSWHSRHVIERCCRVADFYAAAFPLRPRQRRRLIGACARARLGRITGRQQQRNTGQQQRNTNQQQRNTSRQQQRRRCERCAPPHPPRPPLHPDVRAHTCANWQRPRARRLPHGRSTLRLYGAAGGQPALGFRPGFQLGFRPGFRPGFGSGFKPGLGYSWRDTQHGI